MSIEDRFLIIALREDRALLPERETLESVLAAAHSLDPGLQVLGDLRGLRTIYNDIPEALEVLSEYGAQLIAPSRDIAFLQSEFGSSVDVFPVTDRSIPLKFAPLHLLPFEDFHNELVAEGTWGLLADGLSQDLPTEQEWDYIVSRDPTIIELFGDISRLRRHWDSCLEGFRLEPSNPGGTEVLQRRYLQHFMDTNARRSLLGHFTLHATAGTVDVCPYHSGALNTVEAGKETILGRPGVPARRTDRLLRPELSRFEDLVRNPKTTESEIQRFLECHPTVFEAMGYRNVYSQVVLAREDGTSLRPDFILEPLGRPWCDILDLKLPTGSIAVGRRDRKALASAVHELVAQLREYAAYFEDERLAKRVQDAYGIRCYRPRLIGVIGRDPNLADERQKRRMMTAYSDVSVVTFDELFKIARSRLLI